MGHYYLAAVGAIAAAAADSVVVDHIGRILEGLAAVVDHFGRILAVAAPVVEVVVAVAVLPIPDQTILHFVGLEPELAQVQIVAVQPTPVQPTLAGLVLVQVLVVAVQPIPVQTILHFVGLEQEQEDPDYTEAKPPEELELEPVGTEADPNFEQELELELSVHG